MIGATARAVVAIADPRRDGGDRGPRREGGERSGGYGGGRDRAPEGGNEGSAPEFAPAFLTRDD